MTLTPEQYVETLFAPDPDLERVIRGLAERNMPQISIAPGYGRLLTLLVKMSGAADILEIGALGGYSGICLARGLPEGGMLTSLELKPEFAEVAKSHLEAAGLEDKVQYRIGDARESLKQLEEEGKRFDFFFIDADKANYPLYLESAIRLARPGALIVGDNVLLHGKTADPEVHTESAEAMREFNRKIANDPRLEGCILAAADGLAVARVRSG